MKRKITLTKLSPDVYCVVASSLRLLAMTFVRLQEFYESPIEGIKGKYFTLAKFKKLYTKPNGKFTYYNDWAGFNVPSHIVIQFFEKFKDLSPKERYLKDLLAEALTSNKKFYVIGVPKIRNKDIIKHELAHALFYTAPLFKCVMLRAIEKLPSCIKMQVFLKLKEMGYCGHVKLDELQAYMATTRLVPLRSYFGSNIKIRHVSPFRKIFHRFNNVSPM